MNFGLIADMFFYTIVDSLILVILVTSILVYEFDVVLLWPEDWFLLVFMINVL
jgi:hypothetical protein